MMLPNGKGICRFAGCPCEGLNPSTTFWLVVDEAGVCTPEHYGIICDFVTRMRKNERMDVKLVMAGDDNQLPPVKTGSTFCALLDAFPLYRIHLDHDYRVQAGAESALCRVQHSVLNLQPNLPPRNDDSFELHVYKDRSQEAIPHILPADFRPGLDMVLPCTNKTRISWNECLQALHIKQLTQQNRHHDPPRSYQVGFKSFFSGQAIKCCNKSGQLVAKSETEFDKEGQPKTKKIADKFRAVFLNADVVDRKTWMRFAELGKDLGKTWKVQVDSAAEWEPAYSFTIHSSQGKEADCVVVDLRDHFRGLDSRVVFTGITRPRRKLIYLVNVAGYNKLVRYRADLSRSVLIPHILAGILRIRFGPGSDVDEEKAEAEAAAQRARESAARTAESRRLTQILEFFHLDDEPSPPRLSSPKLLQRKRKVEEKEEQNAIWVQAYGKNKREALCYVCGVEKIRPDSCLSRPLFAEKPDRDLRPCCEGCAIEDTELDMMDYVAKNHPLTQSEFRLQDLPQLKPRVKKEEGGVQDCE